MRSLNGPATSWPMARPATTAVSVSWTAAASACSERVISGSPGRYMSIDSGPIATIEPRITISSALEGNAHVLDLRVREQRVDALAAAVAGALHAAEGQLDAAADAVGVDEHLAGADARGDSVRAAEVAGPDARDEPVARRVGKRDRFAIAGERHRGQDGAE